MDLLRIYGATLLLALTVGVSACKNDEAPAMTPTTSEETSTDQKITFNVEYRGALFGGPSYDYPGKHREW